MFIGGFLIPFILVIAFYILVLRSIKSKGRSLRTLFESDEQGKLTPPPTPNGTKSNRSNTLTLLTSEIQSTSVVNRNSMRIQSLISETEDANTNVMNRQLRSAIVKREFQATKSVAICVGFFCLAWLPNAIIVLIAQLGIDIENYVTPLTASLPAILSKTSTIFNPLIYTLLNPDFKVHYKRVLKLNNRHANNAIDFV